MHDLINLNKFLTKSIGFEDIFSRFFELEDFNGGHPFYNIKRIKDDKYILEMALAGYKKSEVKVEVTDGVLSVLKEKPEMKKKTMFIKVLQEEHLLNNCSFLNMLNVKVLSLKITNLESGSNLEYNPPEMKTKSRVTK